VAVAKKKSSKKSSKKSAKKTAKTSRKASAAKKAKSRKSTARKAVKKAGRKAIKKAARKASGSTKTTKGSRKARQRRAASKDYLSKKELKEFREMLVEKRKSLVGDMANMSSGSYGRSLQDSSGDLSNMPTHPADIGSDNFEHEFTLGLLESERALLCEINEALERLENGTYGICLGTGEPIGKPRLKARPWCKFSIEYQRMIEQGLVRPGDHEEDDEEEEDEDLLDDEEREDEDEDGEYDRDYDEDDED
jgi:RNA polymerase-binding protein DksA